MSDLAEPTPAPVASPPRPWSLLVRIGFRMTFIYWAIFCLNSGLLESLLWMLPWAQRGIGWTEEHTVLNFAAWVGTHLFHLTGEAAIWHPTGSGDTALGYVLSFCMLCCAVLGALAWTLLSERRSNGRREYRALYAWLRLALRFTLGGTLLGYGFDKVFPMQFPSPSLLTLTGTYGESSPMRLLWTFMGASVPYGFFCGLAEVVPGLLLLFRRTVALGALLAAGVMFNVVLLNFCYDVPVKLFSAHLLLAALFLLLPDAASLWRIFFVGQTAALTGLSLPPWERRPLRLAAVILQIVTLGGLLYQTGVATYQAWRQEPAGRSLLYGVWLPDGTEGLAAGEVWSKVVFDRPGQMVIVHPDGDKKRFEATFHADTQRIDFTKETKPSALRWTRPTAGALTLTGDWLGSPVTVNLHRLETVGDFPLQTRGFHWVQEYPYNR